MSWRCSGTVLPQSLQPREAENMARKGTLREQNSEEGAEVTVSQVVARSKLDRKQLQSNKAIKYLIKLSTADVLVQFYSFLLVHKTQKN